MKVQLKNAKPASEIQLSDAAFGRVYNEALVHQVVTAYMAAGRSGTLVFRGNAMHPVAFNDLDATNAPGGVTFEYRLLPMCLTGRWSSIERRYWTRNVQTCWKATSCSAQYASFNGRGCCPRPQLPRVRSCAALINLERTGLLPNSNDTSRQNR